MERGSQRSGGSRDLLDRRRTITLEMPRWFPLYGFLTVLSLFALMLALFFLLAWLAYVAGGVASAQQDIRRTQNVIQVKVDRLYTNDRIRRDREEREADAARDPDPPPDR